MKYSICLWSYVISFAKGCKPLFSISDGVRNILGRSVIVPMIAKMDATWRSEVYVAISFKFLLMFMLCKVTCAS